MNSGSTIDLDALLRSKFPRIPRWAVRLLGRILHIDYYNAFFSKGFEGMDFLSEALKYLDIKIETEGLDRLPKDGRYTFACNHPLGGADAIGFVHAIGVHFGGNVRIQVNDFLMAIGGISSICIPVSKVGVQSRELALKTREAFASDSQICVFPAGKCSRKSGGRIQDGPWGKSFVKMSVESGRKVVPCHFSGRNSWRFYLLDRFGKLLSVKKFPLAMILLPDELYRARGKSFRLTVGEPLAPSAFDFSRSSQEWAQHIRSLSYKLNKQ